MGTYDIVITKGSVQSYNVAYVNSTLTITKAPLTVGVEDATITEGDALPAFTLTYDGFRCGDTEATAFTVKPHATTEATAASAPGEYPITVGGGEAKNYELSYTGGTLTIEANPLPQRDDVPGCERTGAGRLCRGALCQRTIDRRTWLRLRPA
ncbi:MAG: hypothetical protein IJ243_01305 [Prevotella sp.]|nr:hypothetical protein [Prevotella sp.]